MDEGAEGLRPFLLEDAWGSSELIESIVAGDDPTAVIPDEGVMLLARGLKVSEVRLYIQGVIRP